MYMKCPQACNEDIINLDMTFLKLFNGEFLFFLFVFNWYQLKVKLCSMAGKC